MQLSGRVFWGCSKKEELGLANSVETVGVDLRKRAKQLGAKEKTRWKKWDVKFPIAMTKRVFQKKKVGLV